MRLRVDSSGMYFPGFERYETMASRSDFTEPKRGIDTISTSAEALNPCGSHCQTGRPRTNASSATVEYVNKMISALSKSSSRLPCVMATRSCLIGLRGCLRKETHK